MDRSLLILNIDLRVSTISARSWGSNTSNFNIILRLFLLLTHSSRSAILCNICSSRRFWVSLSINRLLRQRCVAYWLCTELVGIWAVRKLPPWQVKERVFVSCRKHHFYRAFLNFDIWDFMLAINSLIFLLSWVWVESSHVKILLPSTHLSSGVVAHTFTLMTPSIFTLLRGYLTNLSLI